MLSEILIASHLHSIDMDHNKPDTSTQAPDLVHNISTPSVVDVSPPNLKLSEDFDASGPLNRAPAVSPHTENQEVSSSIGSNVDSDDLLRLLLNPNIGEFISFSNLNILFFMGFRYEPF